MKSVQRQRRENSRKQKQTKTDNVKNHIKQVKKNKLKQNVFNMQ